MDFESIDWIVCQNFENKDYFVYLIWRLPACTRYRKFECVSLDLSSVGIILHLRHRSEIFSSRPRLVIVRILHGKAN
jgi:uncharacterized protein Smg (DUF494 family)